MRYRYFAIMLAMLFLPALLSCATRGAVEPPHRVVRGVDFPEGAFPIQVEHNAPVTTSLTVFLSDGVGARRLLGTVAPSQTETFTVQQPIAPGPHRLIAEGMPGRGITSRPIHLGTRDGVRWSLNTNTVTSLLVEDEP